MGSLDSFVKQKLKFKNWTHVLQNQLLSHSCNTNILNTRWHTQMIKTTSLLNRRLINSERCLETLDGGIHMVFFYENPTQLLRHGTEAALGIGAPWILR